jgi:hypothetical protein
MTNNYFSKNGNAPEDAKYFNHESFRAAWPKVIARVWLYKKENEGSDITEGIEKGLFCNTPESELQSFSEDDKWYWKLLSNDSDLVKRALIEEGLVTLGTSVSNAEENDWSQWISSNILVLPYGGKRTVRIEAVDDGELYSQKGSSNENGWENVKDIDHTVVLTLPFAPEAEEEFALALADYCCTGKTYVFTCS